jgi:low affinity Fe/Cu permease
MPVDERIATFLDELREGRGIQKQINNEVYRRVDKVEKDVVTLDNKMNTLFSRIILTVSSIIGLAIAIISIIEAVKS